MRTPKVLNASLKRMINPFYWGLILFCSLLWTLLLCFFGPGLPPLRVALSPIYLGFAILMIFPMPWQWSGDDRPLPPFLRGLTQAVVWDLFWILIMLGPPFLANVRWARQHPGLPRGGSPSKNQGPPISPGIITLIMGLLAGRLVASQERAEDGEKTANEAAIQARMNVLKSQMNPHVLFNIISGLCEMAREHPEAMERALLDLSCFLRELLDYSARDRAPLSRERALVERYLGLEQIRLGKRLRLSWDWDPALEDLELPPLILQPLVENAIKHGIAPHRGGGALRIRLAGDENALELEVANTGAGLAGAHEERIGMRNARERLAFFDPDAKLSLFQDGEWTRAMIRLGRRS